MKLVLLFLIAISLAQHGQCKILINIHFLLTRFHKYYYVDDYDHAKGLWGPFELVKCKFYECCNDHYLKKDLNRLEENLDKYLFGQPLVKRVLLSSLKGHFNLKSPQKALVLSFHGSTGVGK
jgi:hypothetical protein